MNDVEQLIRDSGISALIEEAYNNGMADAIQDCIDAVEWFKVSPCPPALYDEIMAKLIKLKAQT